MTSPALDIADAMDEAVAAALPTPVVDEAPPAPLEDEATTDEDGLGDAVAPDDAAPEDDAAADETPSVPDGYVAVPVVTDSLATEFRLLDADGELEVPALVIEYKANGKMRKDRLDQVVKLAQWGVYNQERDTRAQQVEQEREQIATVLAEREQQIERLLLDDEFLLAVRDAYEQENAPEKQVARAKEETEALRTSYAMQQIQEQASVFVESQIQPSLDMIASALPSVTTDELAERMQYAMQAHVERAPNGQLYVPPAAYDAVRKYIVEDLAIWAQIQHDRRTPSAPRQPARPEQVVADTRVEAQKAKRVIGQTLRPVGKAASSSTRPTSTTPPATVDDAVDSAIEAVLASMNS